MDYDTVGSQTFSTIIAPVSSATNNAASAVFDTKGYEGMIAIRVSAGVPTAGDAGLQFTVGLQASADTTSTNATNTVGAFGSRLFTGTTNNTAAAATLTFDPRAEKRYLFLRTVITGGNSPATPVAATAIGKLQMQPN